MLVPSLSWERGPAVRGDPRTEARLHYFKTKKKKGTKKKKNTTTHNTKKKEKRNQKKKKKKKDKKTPKKIPPKRDSTREIPPVAPIFSSRRWPTDSLGSGGFRSEERENRGSPGRKRRPREKKRHMLQGKDRASSSRALLKREKKAETEFLCAQGLGRSSRKGSQGPGRYP